MVYSKRMEREVETLTETRFVILEEDIGNLNCITDRVCQSKLSLDDLLECANNMQIEINEHIFEINCLILDKQKLEKENLELESDLDYYKAKCGSLETGLISMDRDYSKLKAKVDDKTVAVEVAISEQFENIIKIIDDKIRDYEQKNHNANTGDCICVKYYNQIECLKELKEVLL